MTQKTRKLWGTVAILALLVVYPLAVMAFYSSYLMGLPWWAAIPVFAVLGALWFFPASWLIRWMAKPDEPSRG